jgi:8-oxo-dGTP diphosphatase
MKYVVKGIIKKNSKYLLQLRDNNPNIVHPNSWCFFGGEKEAGETNWDCLKRELSEEILWTPQKGKYTHGLKYKELNCIIYYYFIEFNYDFSKLVLSEGQDMNWFNLNQINSMNIPYVYDAILESIQVMNLDK